MKGRMKVEGGRGKEGRIGVIAWFVLVLTVASLSEASEPLVAFVGTFSSPLHDVLPTQVDLPPGNGRGIHLFHVDRDTGAMTPSGVVEMPNSPSCLVVNAAG